MSARAPGSATDGENPAHPRDAVAPRRTVDPRSTVDPRGARAGASAAGARTARAGRSDWRAVAVASGLLAALALVLGAAQLRASMRSPAVAQTLELAAAPIARWEMGTAVVGGRLFVFGGFRSQPSTATVRVDVLDPRLDRWSSAAPMPEAATHINAAVQDDRFVWFVGGFVGDDPGPASERVWRYDASLDRWDAGPALPAKRASGGAALLGTSLHYFGGLLADRATNTADHWALDLAHPDGWHARAPMPAPRAHFATAVVGGVAFAIGGQNSHDSIARDGRDLSDRADVWRYDPAGDTWSEVASLPMPRSHIESATSVYAGRIWVVGGRNNSRSRLRRWLRPEYDTLLGMREISVYDPRSDRWSDTASLPVPLTAPAAGVIDGRLIVTGGGIGGWRATSDRSFALHLD